MGARLKTSAIPPKPVACSVPKLCAQSVDQTCAYAKLEGPKLRHFVVTSSVMLGRNRKGQSANLARCKQAVRMTLRDIWNHVPLAETMSDSFVGLGWNTNISKRHIEVIARRSRERGHSRLAGRSCTTSEEETGCCSVTERTASGSTPLSSHRLHSRVAAQEALTDMGQSEFSSLAVVEKQDEDLCDGKIAVLSISLPAGTRGPFLLLPLSFQPRKQRCELGQASRVFEIHHRTGVRCWQRARTGEQESWRSLRGSRRNFRSTGESATFAGTALEKPCPGNNQTPCCRTASSNAWLLASASQ
eukprot:684306-Hanusia_phi.AAC.2